MKIFKSGKRCAVIALTLALSFVMLLNVAPVHAEDEVSPFVEDIVIDISFSYGNPNLYNPDFYYSVYLLDYKGDKTTLVENANNPTEVRLQGLREGEKLIFAYNDKEGNIQEVDVDLTKTIFDLSEYLWVVEDETPPLIEGVVDSITVINTNSDVYYNVSLIQENSGFTSSHVNYTRTIDIKGYELREGDKIILHYLDGDGNSGEIELDPTKEIFNLDEYLGYESVELTVVSSTDAAKTTQFYLCLGDMHSNGEAFTDDKFEALVYTGSLNMFLDKKVLEDETPYIQLFDANKTKIEFETLEDGSFYINLDNYVKTDDSKKTDDDQKTDASKKSNNKTTTTATKTPSTTSSSPKTGDESNPLLATFGLLSGLGVVGICLLKGKKRKIK